MESLNEIIDKLLAESPHTTRIMAVEYYPPRLWVIKTMEHYTDGKTLEAALQKLVELEEGHARG